MKSRSSYEHSVRSAGWTYKICLNIDNILTSSTIVGEDGVIFEGLLLGAQIIALLTV